MMREQLEQLERQMMSEPKETALQLQALLPGIRAAGDFENEAYLYCLLGGCAFFQGDLEQTTEYALHALHLSQTYGYRDTEARSNNALGLVYWRLGRMAEALEQYQRSLELAGELQDSVGLLRVTNNLAAIYADLQDHTRALLHFREAARLARQYDRPDYLADALGGILSLYLETNQNQQGLALAQRAKAIAERHQVARFLCTIYNFEAQFLSRLGQHAAALSSAQVGLELSIRVGDIESQSFIAWTLSELYISQGNTEQAQSYLEMAQSLNSQTGDKQLEIRLIHSQAELYELRGDYAQALSSLKEHVRLREELESRSRQIHSEYVSKQIQLEVMRREAAATRERNSELSHANEQLLSTQSQLTYQATHDTLTGLLNRAAFWQEVESALQALPAGSHAGILFGDIDHLKTVNDIHGHAAGDRLIQEIARRFRSALRPGDVLGRLSGDEFMIYLPDLNTPQDIALLAERLLDAVRLPLRLVGNNVIQPAVSLGSVVAPQDGQDLATLHHNADLALYQAKQQGKNTWVHFQPELSAAESRRRRLSEGLFSATHGQLELYYQAQFTMPQREFTGVEALLRWNHPDLGWISPAEFIPLAEKSRVIFDLGLWVLQVACAQAKAWNFEGRRLVMSVNVSVRQFEHPDFVRLVAAALRTSGLPGYCLMLELTETVLHKEPQNSVKTVEALHALGVRIAIDDFGTGYSSLLLLKHLPFHELKIDRSFVSDLTSQQSGATSARHFMEVMLNLAAGLGLQVVAEGIESQAQFDLLSDLGCDKAQGYWLARPQPAGEVYEGFVRDMPEDEPADEDGDGAAGEVGQTIHPS